MRCNPLTRDSFHSAPPCNASSCTRACAYPPRAHRHVAHAPDGCQREVEQQDEGAVAGRLGGEQLGGQPLLLGGAGPRRVGGGVGGGCGEREGEGSAGGASARTMTGGNIGPANTDFTGVDQVTECNCGWPAALCTAGRSASLIRSVVAGRSALDTGRRLAVEQWPLSDPPHPHFHNENPDSLKQPTVIQCLMVGIHRSRPLYVRQPPRMVFRNQ